MNDEIQIWHCDAGGVYSGFESGAGGGPPPDGGQPGGHAGGGTSDGSYSDVDKAC